MTHDLGNVWIAKKVGKQYEVFHNGEFQFRTARLKIAKTHAK